MNAKEQIIRLLKREIAYFKENDLKTINKLIAATEAAIFDVPSEDEIRKAAQQIGLKAIALPTAQALAFIDGCNFILNYNKPKQ